MGGAIGCVVITYGLTYVIDAVCMGAVCACEPRGGDWYIEGRRRWWEYDAPGMPLRGSSGRLVLAPHASDSRVGALLRPHDV